MRENAIPRLHRRLADPGGPEFPVFEQFRNDGASDYLARLIGFGADPLATGIGLIGSWLSDQEGGFNAEQLALIDTTFDTFALAIRTRQIQQMAATITETYLGRDAGRRVLNGALGRGEVTAMQAVILFTDLSGFTAISEQLPGIEVVELLDTYFDAMAEPVLERGGEVLKFMGDGMLAVFETGNQADEACGRAMAAVLDANRRIETLNDTRAAQGGATMRADMVLHLGEVLYGNVGAKGRLDFTVIGKAVNEASRIEAECDRLGHNILLTREFAQSAYCCAELLLPLGEHRLRDIPNPLELYTVKPEMLNKAA
jgi:adenylate cyclase